jgi:hypothetical protein
MDSNLSPMIWGKMKDPTKLLNMFMVRRLNKKFKQPVCYTLSSKGGAKAHHIKNKVEQILIKLIEMRLKPLVTVFDQDTSNVKVLNVLINSTVSRG